MVIIKIYSQDIYVAAEISVKYADAIAKTLGLTKEDVFLLGSDGALIAEGVDQVSWFTYLEVTIPAKFKAQTRCIKQNAFRNIQ